MHTSAFSAISATAPALLYLLHPCSRLWLMLPVKKFTAEIAEWRFNLSDLQIYSCIFSAFSAISAISAVNLFSD
jgi:hypothetical protein